MHSLRCCEVNSSIFCMLYTFMYVFYVDSYIAIEYECQINEHVNVPSVQILLLIAIYLYRTVYTYFNYYENFLVYLVDPASSHTLVLKIKPCMSKCFDCLTLDCRRLIITVIVLLRLHYRWIPVEILELIHVTNNMSP